MSLPREFIEKLYALDIAKSSQTVKDAVYRDIERMRRGDRKLLCWQPDELGFNLWHWAVLSNQPQEEFNYLKRYVDVNDVSQSTPCAEFYNITPFYFAMHTGNERMANLLRYHYGADPDIHPILSSNDSHKTVDSDRHSVVPVKKEKRKTFTLFEKNIVAHYHSQRENDHREYKSILPDCLASLFHYSRTEKLAAEQDFEVLLKKEPAEPNQWSIWCNDLRNLKVKHPAIDQGELGNIYHASLKTRGL